MSNMLEVADLGHTYGDYEAIGGLIVQRPRR